MQIATWNVNSLKVRLPQVLEWLNQTRCDVLALQELKIDNDNFPLAALVEHGYYCAFNGQRTYNGVAIISKFPLVDICYDIPDYADPQKRVISATIAGVRVVCVYVVNGESVESDKYKYKLAWCSELHGFIAKSLTQFDKLVLLGDFNIAPHDIDVYDPVAWSGKVLCSEPEREVWHRLLKLGLHDSFRLFNSEANQYSWWDYRSFAFRRKLGMRIDHVLISDSVKQLATDCIIDINPRKNERPSDHTPVILSLAT